MQAYLFEVFHNDGKVSVAVVSAPNTGSLEVAEERLREELDKTSPYATFALACSLPRGHLSTVAHIDPEAFLQTPTVMARVFSIIDSLRNLAARTK